jgi:hypothetical protein
LLALCSAAEGSPFPAAPPGFTGGAAADSANKSCIYSAAHKEKKVTEIKDLYHWLDMGFFGRSRTYRRSCLLFK